MPAIKTVPLRSVRYFSLGAVLAVRNDNMTIFNATKDLSERYFNLTDHASDPTPNSYSDTLWWNEKRINDSFNGF